MSEKIVQLNEEIIKGQIRELVCSSAEGTMNELLEKEAESLTQAPATSVARFVGATAAATTTATSPRLRRRRTPYAAAQGCSPLFRRIGSLHLLIGLYANVKNSIQKLYPRRTQPGA